MTRTDLLSNPMTSAGDVIYGGASGVPTRLAKGTADQVLTMNAGATAPEWADAASGGSSAARCHIRNTAAQTSSSGTALAVAWNSEIFDDATTPLHSTASENTKITAPAAGLLIVRPRLFVAALSTTGGQQLQMYARKNGTTQLDEATTRMWAPGTNDQAQSLTMRDEWAIVMANGDYIEVMFLQTISTTLAIGHSSVASARNYCFAEFWPD